MSRARLLLSLLFMNAAVFVAAVAFLPRARASHVTWSPDIPMSYFVASRDRWDIPWILLLASVLVSVGVYILAGNSPKGKKDT